MRHTKFQTQLSTTDHESTLSFVRRSNRIPARYKMAAPFQNRNVPPHVSPTEHFCNGRPLLEFE
jgi:hypothetical protein